MSTSAGSGGTGGGGNGQKGNSPTAGTANTGGGGGAGDGNSAAGGSGIIILRMPTASYSGSVTGSPTVATDGSDTVISFTSTGTIVG